MDGVPQLTPEIVATLAVCGGAFGLFVWGRLRLEVVGLTTVAAVVLLGLVSPSEAVSGFANEAVVTVALVLGLSTGLLRTGAVDLLGRWIERLAGDSEMRMLVAILAMIVPVSALINNTAAVAVLIPMVVGLSRRSGIPASRLLMPLSYGSQLGGTLTLIGTSTNLLVAGMVLDHGLDRIGLFEITPAAAVLAVLGIGYLLTVGRWLTPRREPQGDTPISRGLREYLSEMRVPAGSELAGAVLADADLEDRYDVRLLGLIRDDDRRLPEDDLRLEKGDRLLVSGALEQIVALAADDQLVAEHTASRLGEHDRPETDLRTAEMLVAPRSRAIGRDLHDLRRRLSDTVSVLALERHGEELREPIGELELDPGDILLFRGPLDRLQALHESGDFALLGMVDLPPKRTERMAAAVGIMLAVVVTAATGLTSIMVAALVGMLAMILTGCVRMEEVYQHVDWQVIVLLGSLLGLGATLESTGTARYLAAAILQLVRDLGPAGVLATFYLLTSVLTEMVTNNAAAIVLTPIAIATAGELGVSAMPFVVAVMFAASNSFATPVGYQTNTFIHAPGGYRFVDFVRVGGPMVLVMAAVAALVLPLFFPF